MQVLKDHVRGRTASAHRVPVFPLSSDTAPVSSDDLSNGCWRLPAQDDTPADKFRKLEDAVQQYPLPVGGGPCPCFRLAVIAAPCRALSAPHPHTPAAKAENLGTILAFLLELPEEQPVLFIVEDLHWIDPSTLELLTLLVDQGPTAPLLTLLTCRPDFPPAVASALVSHGYGVQRLSQAQVEQIARDDRWESLAPRGGRPDRREDGWRAAVCRGTDQGDSGIRAAPRHPGALRTDGSLPPLAIPATLQDSLVARLDRLATVKAVAQYGAVMGRSFRTRCSRRYRHWTRWRCSRPWPGWSRRRLLYQRGVPPQATYLFKHALIQEAAYQSLLKSTRQQYHQRIAQVLEQQFPETAATQPELLAHHYTEAGLPEQAVRYWQRAGQHASDRSAYLEAISHLTTGIELLRTLPETPEHTQQALTLYIGLGAALLVTKGYGAPEVEHAYTQAYALCQQVGETPELVPVLLGLWRFYLARPQLHTAREIGDTLLHLARRTDDPALAVLAHYALGCPWLWLGALPVARQHLEEAIACYTPDQRHAPEFRIGHDLGVACRFYAAQILWLLGYPAQALARLHDALTLAHALSHPLSLAWMRCRAAIFFQVCRDVPAVLEQAEAAVALATAQGFPQWAAWGMIMRGWALAMQGQGEVGMVQVHQGIPPCGPPGQRCTAPTYAPYWRTSLPTWATRTTASRRWPRPTPWSSSMRTAAGKRKSVASGASCSCGSQCRNQRRRKPGCSALWTSPAARRRSRWSCGPP